MGDMMAAWCDGEVVEGLQQHLSNHSMAPSLASRVAGASVAGRRWDGLLRLGAQQAVGSGRATPVGGASRPPPMVPMRRHWCKGWGIHVGPSRLRSGQLCCWPCCRQWCGAVPGRRGAEVAAQGRCCRRCRLGLQQLEKAGTVPHARCARSATKGGGWAAACAPRVSP